VTELNKFLRDKQADVVCVTGSAFGREMFGKFLALEWLVRMHGLWKFSALSAFFVWLFATFPFCLL